MSFFKPVAELATRQHGAISSVQLRGAGVTQSHLRTLVAKGVVTRAARGVYVLAGSSESWERQLMVAVLVGGPLALAGHRSAAGLWSLDRFRPGHVEVAVEAPAPRRRHGFVVHESTVLPTRDRTTVRGVPVTTPTRTLIDIGRFVGAARLGSMVDDAVRRELTSYEELHMRFAELAGRGRDGIATIRRVLEDRPGGAVVPDSPLEQEVRATLVRAGIPEPVLHHRVDCDEISYVLDLAWPGRAVAVECDGFRFHRTPDDLEWDDRRRNALGLRGWMVLHATWRRMRHDAPGFVREVRTALGSRA